ncbi:DsbA family protein [Corynebacterium sp. A21]|uniref:DsbA family protein n=1 Tax=Corynebacterium sp. A21 TaxID=3457318 RepID=UPI003FD40319
MSNKIKSPNEKSNGFIWAIVAVLVIAVVVVGYIVYSSKDAKTEWIAEREFQDVQFDAVRDGDMITLKSDQATESTPVVGLFEDFSCPHCGELAIATDAQLKDAVEGGELVVNIEPLHFLDRENTSGNSHRSLAAALSVLEHGDADLYWNFRTLLLENQDDIVNKWEDEDFAAAATTLGAPSAVAESINNGEFQEDAAAIGTANATYLQEQTGSLSSPRIIQDGKDIAENDLNNWVEIAKQG